MKKLLSFFLLLIVANQLQAQSFAYIPDAQFRAYISSISPAAMVGDSLNINDPIITTLDSVNVSGLGITSLDGIEYFDSLHILEAAHNNIVEVHYLPTRIVFKDDARVNLSNNSIDSLRNSITTSVALMNVRNLNLSHNSLSGSFNSNTAWVSLDISFNSFTSFSFDYSRLVYFNCSHNNLQYRHLNNSPALRYLDCSYNQITTVFATFAAHPQLSYYNISHNRLSQKPFLNPQLSVLNIDFNQLLQLDSLPAGLTELYCNDNYLVSLNGLPATLTTLQCANNNLTCLPTLPNTLQQLQATGNYILCLRNLPSNPAFTADVAFNGSYYDICPNGLCQQPVHIGGYAFFDVNGNGVKDTLEPPLTNILISAQPFQQILLTDASGYYEFEGYAGLRYTIKPIQPGVYTPDSLLAMVPLPLTDSVDFNFAFSTDTFTDVQVYLTKVKPAVLQKKAKYQLTVINVGNTIESGTISLSYDNTVFSLSQATAGYQQTGSVLSWPYDSLYTGAVLTFDILLDVVYTGNLPHYFQLAAAATTFNTDSLPLNNEVITTDSILNTEGERNKKTVSPANYNSGNLYAGDYLDYTIFFANDNGSEAVNVWIIDTLSSYLDINSLEVVDASHPYFVTITGNELRVDFSLIFLPLDSMDPVGSHGFFRFRIKPRSLPSNGKLSNIAYIYFDGLLGGGGPVSTDVNICFSPLSISLAHTNIQTTSCGGQSGSATVYVNAGTAPFTYTWSTGESSSSIGPLNQGTYYITVTDACRTTAVSYAIVDSFAVTHLIANISATPVTCAGNNATATVSACGGSGGPLSYSWNNGQSGATATGLYPGNYRCSVSDGVAQPTIAYVTIADYDPMQFTNIYVANCQSSSNLYGIISLQVFYGTYPHSYAWSNGETTSYIDSLASGTYSCTVTDARGCTLTTSQIISSAVGLRFDSVVIRNTTCYPNAGSISYSVSGNPNAQVELDGDNLSLNRQNYPLSGGWHHLRAFTNGSCGIDTSFYITPAIMPPYFTVYIEQEVTCKNGNDGRLSVYFADTIPPGFTYYWTYSNTQTLILDSLQAGYYNVILKDTINNCVYSRYNTLSDPHPVKLLIYNDDTLICTGSTIKLSAYLTGNLANSYNWQWPHSNTVSGNAVYITNAQPQQSGYYVVTASNACTTIVDSVLVIVNPLPAPVITRVGDTLQINSKYLLYNWVLNGSAAGNHTNKLLITANGNYMVEVTDSFGCLGASQSFNVTGLAVNKISEQGGMQLYPNPNTGWFTIQFSDNMTHEVEIADALGRVIIPTFKAQYQTPIKLEDAAAGIYFVHCKQLNAATRTLKFTVVK